MKTITDEVFGRLTYDYQWERQVDKSLWDRQFELLLIVASDSDDDDTISDVQRQSYKEFLVQHTDLEQVMLKKLIQYCKTDLGISDCNEESFWRHNIPTSIFFPLTGEWAILFDSEYDEEGGLAVVVRNGHIDDVGSQDIIL